MSTVQDAFLDDLDDIGGSEEDEDEELESNGHFQTQAQKTNLDIDEDDDDDDDDDDDAGIGIVGISTDEDGLASVAKLRKSAHYKRLLQLVAPANGAPDTKNENENGDLNTNQPLAFQHNETEYDIIIKCNKMIIDIDEEITNVHKFVVDVYNKKFPELIQMVTNPIDYVRTVQAIGNEMDMTVVDLGDILPSSAVMAVSVTGSTTSGMPLSMEEIKQALDGCDEILVLHEDKRKILSFLESRMSSVAPNVCAIIGSRIASQLIGMAGGLQQLSKIPSCNLQVMGQEKNKQLAGFGRAASLPHTGIMYYCELVQSAPPHLRQKALKVVAAKVALAARCDCFQDESQPTDGVGGIFIGTSSAINDGMGRKFYAEIAEKIDKWQEPAKAKIKKALPRPDDKPSRRRGGKRYRKQKERLGLTAVRKDANRRTFASMEGAEYGDDAMGMDFGMLGTKEGGGTGRIRAPPPKSTSGGGGGPEKKQKRAVSISSGQTSGLSSSLVFTPVQGLELVNPNAAEEKVKEANKKWFDKNSGFLSAKPK